jgi:diacylglycerol diphosphate phosphatase / phosphatidate phosphatase
MYIYLPFPRLTYLSCSAPSVSTTTAEVPADFSLFARPQLWTVHSTRARYFPITFTASGDIVYPSLAYPYVPAVFSALAAGLLSALIPVAVILLCQIHPRIRSFDDASSGVLGLAYSLVTGNFFQVVLKKSIGGYRPHFLSVCQPVIPKNGAHARGGSGFESVMYRSEICTGSPSKIQNAMESFPSGHSQIAFAGLLYLSIYLNAHLRVFSFSATHATRRPRHWTMLAVVAPVLLATYLSSTLVLGHHHHWYDVIFGALIGSVMAIWAYKMVFVSLWDGRTNYQPLRRDKKDESDGLRANADNGVLPTTRQDVDARI